MMPREQKELGKIILASWKGVRSNYIIVTPPMSGEKEFINLIASKSFLYEVLQDNSVQYRVANIDPSNFKTELSFAGRVASEWGYKYEAGSDDDAVTILELACDWVIKQKCLPILIVQRFHEAIDRLGESIGTALRNLEHEHKLKTVVTMPVKLTTLRERWESTSRGVAPFLASDWGQGHSVKVLPGYTKQELISLFEKHDKTSDQAEAVYSATGGFKELIDRLLDEIEGKRGQGLERFLLSRTGELCERLVKWIEAPNSTHGYKKSLVNLLSPNLYQPAAGLISTHDWAPLVLSKKNELVFKMLAWACQAELARKPEHSWLSALSAMIKRENFTAARSLIQTFSDIDERHNDLWRAIEVALDFSVVGDKLFSENVDWVHLKDKLDMLKKFILEMELAPKYTASLDAWCLLFQFLENFHLHRSVNHQARLEQYVCEKTLRTDVFLVFQLLRARLHASASYEPFQRVQSIITMPESILQIYAYWFYNVVFWDFNGLGESLSKEFTQFMRREYRLNNGTLGYSDLASLISFYSQRESGGKLLADSESFQSALKQYETRKTLTHSTAFASVEACDSYQEFCAELLSVAEADLNIHVAHLDVSVFSTIADELLSKMLLISALKSKPK